MFRVLTEGGPMSGATRLETPTAGRNDDLERALRRSVETRAFTYAAQPILDLRAGEVAFHELLIRFDLPAATAELIEIAETVGLIGAIDAAALDAAAGFLAASRDRAGLCVNVSAQTLTEARDTLALLAAVERMGPKTSRLVLEVTESAEITNLVVANAAIQALRARGCRVWLDDFGAGFASLPYLQALEVDGVKIDGGYVAAACRSPRDERLLAGLVAFSRELKVETTAERIETPEQAGLAARVGATYGQGYLFGRPALLATAATGTAP